MNDSGLWLALYSATTFLVYSFWRLLGKPVWIETLRNYGNTAAIFLPFPIYWLIFVDYIPHGTAYVAYIKGYIQISNSCRKIQSFYQFLPLVFFIFALPIVRKSWQTSLIISLIVIPAIDFEAFSTWLYAIPDDFYRGDSSLDEVLHMKLFAQRFNLFLAVYAPLLLLILGSKKNNGT